MRAVFFFRACHNFGNTTAKKTPLCSPSTKISLAVQIPVLNHFDPYVQMGNFDRRCRLQVSGLPKSVNDGCSMFLL
jgi:hypothetical protein